MYYLLYLTWLYHKKQFIATIIFGAIFIAIIQSSSAATGIVIVMAGSGVITVEAALFIVLGSNIGTCVTALLASVGANANSKRVALVHFTFNVIGTVIFTAVIMIFKKPVVNMLVSAFPGSDPMSLQMRVSLFHVIFNTSTTCVLLPFVKHLVNYSCMVIKDKQEDDEALSLKFVDDRLISTPPVAFMQVKKEFDYMISLAEENTRLSFVAMETGSDKYNEQVCKNERIIDFTNSALTAFLIKLSSVVEGHDEKIIGSYFHVLNDLERIGDHAENFNEIGIEMIKKNIVFSDNALSGITKMRDTVLRMFEIAKDGFVMLHKDELLELTKLEESVDAMKKEYIASHFARLAEGNCSVDVSPYYSSVISGLERVADHIVNVGYSIVNPTGSQKEKI